MAENEKVEAMTEKQRKQQEVINLQWKLNSTDYKVIKCSEAKLLGNDIPYDVKTVVAERQAIRDQINELQEEIAKMQAE